MEVKIKILRNDAMIPTYATDGAAGFDLYAVEDVYVEHGKTCLVKTGLSFEIPEGYEVQIRPRSGLSLKTPLRIANAPGTIDSDYRGEVCIIMESNAVGGWPIRRGDRVAQGILAEVKRANFMISFSDLTTTARGSGGFGSTGA